MIMKKITLALAVASLAAMPLAGCGSLTVPNKPASREWIEVSCSGFANWEVCYKKADRFCPNGYDTANKEESLVAQRRTMLIACKN